MPTSAPWPAPAKLNLFLHIIGQRDDGYHLLQTVFQFVDYGDELDFEVCQDSDIQRVGEVPGVAPEQDLITQAARLLQQTAHIHQGAKIHVQKRLPMGAGLGGGSSDAATVLVALNRLWGIDLETAHLAKLGLQLGADVPVFVHGLASWAEGIGEILTPLELDEPWYIIVTPACQVSTKDIFSAPDLTRNVPPIKIRDFLCENGVNVCESVVRRAYPEVDQAMEWLSQFAPAKMSGTGASVFAAFSHEADARNVYNSAPQRWQVMLAAGRNRSPLLDRLDKER